MQRAPIAVVAVCLALAACRSPLILAYEPGQVVDADGGMVVCADGTAAEVGAAVLRDGGNAVDAAVATAFALGVTYPQAGGPGGGGFAVVAMPDREPDALDFRETAPAAATEDMFLDPDGGPIRKRSLRTRLGAGVPGTPAGLFALHQKHGRLPWERLVEPAVALARNGFPIPDGLAAALNEHADAFRRDPAARAAYVREDRPWQAGDHLVQPYLARTLQAIRDRGAAGFHEGEIARLLAEDMRRNGGLVTVADLRGYRPVWRRPVRFPFRESEVVTMPLPASGGVVLPQILGMMERSGGPNTLPMTPDRLHLFAEASRRAFADRNAHLGDPAGLPPGLAEALIDPDYLDRRAASIDRRRATPSGEVGPGRTESDSTTNLCVIDGAGGAVALTYTLNSTFGTHIMATGTGVLWNNEMDDFAAKPGAPNQFGLRQGAANAIVPGRRPLSSMSPTLVMRDGRVVLAVGSPGGPRILSAVALVLLRHVGDRLPLDVAVLAPRVHHQHRPDRIDYERATTTWPRLETWTGLVLSPEKIRALRDRGHDLWPRTSAIGNVTAISVDPESKRMRGVADGRGYGRAAAERPVAETVRPRISRLPR